MQPGYAEQPTGYGQDPGHTPAERAAPGTTLRLFGQTFTIPVALPPAVGRYLPRIATGAVGVAALLVLFVGILPPVATAQMSGANQSLVTAASHQDKIDAVFTQFFDAKSYTNDPTANKNHFDKIAKSSSDGLAQVKSDEAAVGAVELRLTVLQWLTPSKFAGIAAVRHRLNVALAGLKQADQALTAAVNEANVIQPYIDALIDYTKMGAALAKRDWAAAGAPYSDAQQKIGLTISYSHAAGLPPQIAKQVSSFKDVLTNGEGLIQATQAKDAAGIKTYTDAINVALKAMSSPDEIVPADYETRTFGPMQKAYDAAMKAIKSPR